MKVRWIILPVLLAAGGGMELSSDTVEGSHPAMGDAPSAAPAAQPDPQRELHDVIARLSGTRWALELQPMFGPKPEAPIKDTLSFDGSQMTSERLGATGFPPSNFTLTVGDDGVTVWEATQMNPDEGITLWRGELHEHTINGTVSACPLKGSTEDFIFVGQEVIQPPPPAAAEPTN